MPIYAQLDQFMARVGESNWHFEWIKNSSLHNLIRLLKRDSTANQVRDAIDVIPADKQLKYTAALDFLRGSFPGLTRAQPPQGGLRVVPNLGVQGLRRVGQAQGQRPAPPLPPARNLNVVQAPILTQGYSLIADPDPITLLPAPQRVPAFTKAQIQRINEAVARCKRAVELAIDTLAVVRAPDPRGPATAEQTLYTRLFGEFSTQRRATARDNFLSIGAVLGGVRGGRVGTLNLIDARNDQEKSRWYAATVRNSAGGNSVNMWVGRTFFIGGGDYDVSSDATVVTMVHELAHACFGASDVPTVASGLVLDGTGMPPNGAPVCNALSDDEDLATDDADLALRNADNYGQFAWLALQSKGG